MTPGRLKMYKEPGDLHFYLSIYIFSSDQQPCRSPSLDFPQNSWRPKLGPAPPRDGTVSRPPLRGNSKLSRAPQAARSGVLG